MRPRKQRQVASPGIAGPVVAALALLLAMALAVPASAETTGSLDALPAPAAEAPTPVDSDPAPVEDVQAGTEEAAPAPSPSPEPVEAPAAAESTAPEPASAPVPPSQTSTSDPAPARQLNDTPALPSADRGVATTLRADDRVASIGGLDETVAPIAAGAADPVGEVQRSATGTTGAIAEPLVRAAERNVPLETAHTTLRIASSDRALAAVATPVREALRKSLGAIDPSTVEALLPRLAQDFSSPLGTPTETNGLAPADRTRSLAGSPGEGQALVPEGAAGNRFPSVSLAPDPVAFGGVQPSTGAASDALAGPAEAAAFSATSVPDKLLVDSVNSRLPGNSPADLPSPPSRSPGAAPGSGGSIFVPLAALLALLALAASATSRRLGEVPVFRPPTPFVCALERPG